MQSAILCPYIETAGLGRRWKKLTQEELKLIQSAHRSEHKGPLSWLRGCESLLNHISQGVIPHKNGSKQAKGGMIFINT